MKKIHFDELKRKRTTGKIILFSIVLVALLVLVFFVLSYESKIASGILGVLGFLPLLIMARKTFIFPHYVGWSGSYINIRLNSWYPKSLMFNEVIEVTQSDQKIVFWKRYDKQIEIDLKGYSNEDIEKFKTILSENLRSKAHFEEKPSWIQS